MNKIIILLLGLITSIVSANPLTIDVTSNTVPDETKDWKIGMKNLKAEKTKVNISLDLGLGDTVFPGVEKAVIEKLDKAFNPIVDSLKEIKQKNVQRLNTDRLKGTKQKITNAFMNFIGLSEDRIDKIMKYARCSNTGQSEPNSIICTQSLDYSPQGGALLAGIQTKIKDMKQKLMDKYKSKVSDRLQSVIDKIKEVEDKVNEMASFEMNMDIDFSLKTLLAKGCEAGMKSVEVKDPLLNDMMSGFCDASIHHDMTKFYDVMMGLKGIEDVQLEYNYYFQTQFQAKPIDACKVIEMLNSNDPEIRLQAKSTIKEKVRQLMQRLQEEIVKVVLEELIQRIPILFIKEQMLDMPMCFIYANIKVEKDKNSATDGTDADGVMSGITSVMSNLSSLGSQIFGDGGTEMRKDLDRCYEAIKGNTNDAGDETVKEGGLTLNETMTNTTIPLTNIRIGLPNISIPNLNFGIGTNIKLATQKETFKNCLMEQKSPAFKKAFDNCMEGKTNFQFFNMDNPLIPQMQFQALNLQLMKKQKCEFDKEEFQRKLPHKEGKVNVNIDFLTDILPRAIKLTPQNPIPQGNLFVVKQKLIKKGVQFDSFKDEKSYMYDFYNSEYNNIIKKENLIKGKKVDNYHKNALCYISYDDDKGQTTMGSERGLGRLFGISYELQKEECLITNDKCSIIKNNKVIYPVEWVNNGYNLAGYTKTCSGSDGVGSYEEVVYKNGIGNYCHKLAIDINRQLNVLENSYLKPKVCSNEPVLSCQNDGDCGTKGGICIEKLYSPLLAQDDAKLNGFRQALTQFVSCVALTEKIKGSKITNPLGEETQTIGKVNNKSKMAEVLFKVKMNIKTRKEAMEEMMLFNEYRELFNEKIKLDKDDEYLKNICMNIKEPKDLLNLTPDYVLCKELKIRKQQEVKYDLLSNEWKNCSSIMGDDKEIYDKRTLLEEENRRLEKLLNSY